MSEPIVSGVMFVLTGVVVLSAPADAITCGACCAAPVSTNAATCRLSIGVPVVVGNVTTTLAVPVVRVQ